MPLEPADLSRLTAPVVLRRQGWRLDPSQASGLRWWDGSEWTDRTRSYPQWCAPLGPAGVVAGLLFPIAGIVIALILLLRERVGAGLAALVASGLGAWLWLVLYGV